MSVDSLFFSPEIFVTRSYNKYSIKLSVCQYISEVISKDQMNWKEVKSVFPLVFICKSHKLKRKTLHLSLSPSSQCWESLLQSFATTKITSFLFFPK